LGRKLAEEQRQIAARAHDPAGRSDRVGREVAWYHHAPAEDQLAAMAARHRRGPRYRHVGMCFIQPSGIDDLALDPGGERLAGEGLDREADEAESVVGILESRVGLDRGRGLEIRHQLVRVEEAAPIRELARILPVADDAGAVRQDLAKRGAGNPRVQIPDVMPDLIVELELALFA